MKSSGVFLLTIHQLRQVKNDLKLKIFSLLYFLRHKMCLNIFLTSAKMFIFTVFFFFFFFSSIRVCSIFFSAYNGLLNLFMIKQSAHKGFLNLFINNQPTRVCSRPQGFAQSVHKQSAHKSLLNQANFSMLFSVYRPSLKYFRQ